MATVHEMSRARKAATRHYAHLGDVEGIATLVNGSGYLFRPTGERKAVLVHYADPRLILHGYVEETPEDTRPLWMRIADPGYYEGRAHRELVRGR